MSEWECFNAINAAAHAQPDLGTERNHQGKPQIRFLDGDTEKISKREFEQTSLLFVGIRDDDGDGGGGFALRRETHKPARIMLGKPRLDGAFHPVHREGVAHDEMQPLQRRELGERPESRDKVCPVEPFEDVGGVDDEHDGEHGDFSMQSGEERPGPCTSVGVERGPGEVQVDGEALQMRGLREIDVRVDIRWPVAPMQPYGCKEVVPTRPEPGFAYQSARRKTVRDSDSKASYPAHQRGQHLRLNEVFDEVYPLREIRRRSEPWEQIHRRTDPHALQLLKPQILVGTNTPQLRHRRVNAITASGSPPQSMIRSAGASPKISSALGVPQSQGTRGARSSHAERAANNARAGVGEECSSSVSSAVNSELPPHSNAPTRGSSARGGRTPEDGVEVQAGPEGGRSHGDVVPALADVG
ncbi:hypothetical protein C8R44DRAFT_856325 [Mycena epipterygia]|nr:hypothetical protein C8R44DRAFT_856325 [Mycena epipterygia]